MNVYSAKLVPNAVESILSLNVATIASSDFLLIFAETIPDGIPDFLKRTFQDFIDFPIKIDDANCASSPYLCEAANVKGCPCIAWNSYIIENWC